MKTILKLSFVALFAICACSGGGGSSNVQSNGIREVTSIADFALGYLIASDSCDSATLAKMKTLRNLDQDMRRSGTGEHTLYEFMASCRCLCGGLCCSCGGNLQLATPVSVSSVRLTLGDSVKSNPDSELVGGINIFTLDVTNVRGNLDLVIEYDSGRFSMPVTITSEGALQLRMP